MHIFIVIYMHHKLSKIKTDWDIGGRGRLIFYFSSKERLQIMDATYTYVHGIREHKKYCNGLFPTAVYTLMRELVGHI
jgi:hypothetical protein